MTWYLILKSVTKMHLTPRRHTVQVQQHWRRVSWWGLGCWGNVKLLSRFFKCLQVLYLLQNHNSLLMDGVQSMDHALFSSTGAEELTSQPIKTTLVKLHLLKLVACLWPNQRSIFSAPPTWLSMTFNAVDHPISWVPLSLYFQDNMLWVICLPLLYPL